MHRKNKSQKENLRFWSPISDTDRKLRYSGRPAPDSVPISSNSIDIMQDSVSYSLSGSPSNGGRDSKLFPVTDVGENHLSFLTLFPIQIHTRVSLRFHSRRDPKETLSIEGDVIYCVPGKYASGYRYQIVVLFDPQCVKNEDGYFKKAEDEGMGLNSRYVAAI